MIRAEDIMTRKVISVSADTSLEDLCGLLHEGRITGAPVVDGDGLLVGIVSKDDIVGAYFRDRMGDEAKGVRSLLDIAEEGGPQPAARSSRTVADIMTSEVVTAAEDTPVSEICELMVTNEIHRVPVVRDGHVVGIVSSMNVLEAVLENKLSL